MMGNQETNKNGPAGIGGDTEHSQVMFDVAVSVTLKLDLLSQGHLHLQRGVVPIGSADS